MSCAHECFFLLLIVVFRGWGMFIRLPPSKQDYCELMLTEIYPLIHQSNNQFPILKKSIIFI